MRDEGRREGGREGEEGRGGGKGRREGVKEGEWERRGGEGRERGKECEGKEGERKE